jgi:hypothetical protein
MMRISNSPKLPLRRRKTVDDDGERKTLTRLRLVLSVVTLIPNTPRVGLDTIAGLKTSTPLAMPPRRCSHCPLNRFKRRQAQEIAHQVKYIETAVDPDFQEEFVRAMHLPHKVDAFPHLEGILPEVAEAAPRQRERRRRRE